MTQLPHLLKALDTPATLLHTPFLFFVRAYWGWQFFQTGWGKLNNLPRVTEFFASLGIPFPALNAPFVASLEALGGLLLLLGLATRPIAFLLTANMFVAYLTADRAALFSLFTEPDKLTAAAPFPFLAASLLVFLFGPGRLSLDHRLQS